MQDTASGGNRRRMWIHGLARQPARDAFLAVSLVTVAACEGWWQLWWFMLPMIALLVANYVQAGCNTANVISGRQRLRHAALAGVNVIGLALSVVTARTTAALFEARLQTNLPQYMAAVEQLRKPGGLRSQVRRHCIPLPKPHRHLARCALRQWTEDGVELVRFMLSDGSSRRMLVFYGETNAVAKTGDCHVIAPNWCFYGGGGG